VAGIRYASSIAREWQIGAQTFFPNQAIITIIINKESAAPLQ